jgi:hypothetical protein
MVLGIVEMLAIKCEVLEVCVAIQKQLAFVFEIILCAQDQCCLGHTRWAPITCLSFATRHNNLLLIFLMNHF